MSIFPDANVQSSQVNNYPIEVEIKTDGVSVWKGSQKGLFRKNGHRAVPEIKKKLTALKQ